MSQCKMCYRVWVLVQLVGPLSGIQGVEGHVRGCAHGPVWSSAFKCVPFCSHMLAFLLAYCNFNPLDVPASCIHILHSIPPHLL